MLLGQEGSLNGGNAYSMAKYGADDFSSIGGSTAAAGAASSFNPYVLAATIGLNLLNRRAEDERQRRANAAQIEQQASQGEQQNLNSMLSGYGRALLR